MDNFFLKGKPIVSKLFQCDPAPFPSRVAEKVPEGSEVSQRFRCRNQGVFVGFRHVPVQKPSEATLEGRSRSGFTGSGVASKLGFTVRVHHGHPLRAVMAINGDQW